MVYEENQIADCGCARPCCYYQNPSCCVERKPCCPPQPPPLPCCPTIPLPTVNCLATVPPCLRACPTCPCRKRIFLGKRTKRQDALHCQPGISTAKPSRTALASTKAAQKPKRVSVTEVYDVDDIEAPPRAGRLYERDRAHRVKRSGVGIKL
ncbi:hypothetical protein DICVIV_02244 [Dictyocaulus viviparus]|uniref:Uncharacterized protein n=1 Tax=Dictyocaulus viviparus TaxID=29172 RepID=A0A0D8YAI9_DICVI|nr:hypothetical protein DICVIV_02244 [Dictyocaulus viviparus]